MTLYGNLALTRGVNVEDENDFDFDSRPTIPPVAYDQFVKATIPKPSEGLALIVSEILSKFDEVEFYVEHTSS